MTQGQRGCPLIEVLLALFILGLGVLAAAPMFMYAQQSNAIGGDYGKIAATVSARLEALRSEDYASLVAGGSLTSSVAGYSDAAVPDVVVRWTIVDNTTPPNTKTITVRSEALRQVQGQPRQFTLSALRAR